MGTSSSRSGAALQFIFQAIATARNERELRLRFVDTVGEYFGVRSWGIHLLADDSHSASSEVYGVSDAFLERYRQFGRAIDPVLGYVVERHAPAHEQMLLTPQQWKQSELYQHCCSYYDHDHIMTGAIVGTGKLVGIVNFARGSGTCAFNAGDIADLGAICAHLSACLAILRTHSTEQLHPALLEHLTARELQIAQLVAQGLTNAEVGAELWITQNSVKQALKRMFRKLNVSSRTELVARIYSARSG